MKWIEGIYKQLRSSKKVIKSKEKLMNKSIALIALLAVSAFADECDPDLQCTLYDAENYDESNG